MIYDGLNLFINKKVKKLDKEIVELKSKLYDNQESLISKVKKDNEVLIEKFKGETFNMIKNLDEKTIEHIESFKKENNDSIKIRQEEAEKILRKLNLLDESVFDKLKKIGGKKII